MFKYRKLIAVIAVIAFGTGAVVWVKKHYVLPIIMYHAVRPEQPKGNRLIVTTRTFERQMDFLQRHRYNVVPLETAVDYIVGGKRIPPRTVIITFDDGTADNYTQAFPILKKYGIPATIFVIVSEVGRPGMLSWEQIKEMQGSGLVTFGSHTMTHPFLKEISSFEELKRQITGSKRLLEAELRRPVHTFAYPMGNFNPRVESLVREAGYTVAVATNPGKKFPDNDILALKRLRISENAGNLFVFWFETTGFYTLIKENKRSKNPKAEYQIPK